MPTERSDPDFSDLFHAPAAAEDLADGAAWLLDLVAAVDYLSRGQRHGLTVWDAIEEALRHHHAETLSLVQGIPDPELEQLSWDDPDPLRTALQRLTDVAPGTTAQTLQAAVRR